MTKGDNISLYQNLTKLGKLSGVKFAYAVAKNIAILKPELEALQKSLEAAPEYTEFEKARIALAESMAKKDENGKPVSEDGKFVMEDDEAFEKAFTALKEEHKDALEARKVQIEEQNELLKTESTIVLHKVKLEDVPREITVEQMQSIAEIVED